ncbi:MAG: hypothetical protein K2Q13_10150 [Nitrosomonas sp.]|uniref:hypothetical protein n=1 Tax=Nitrosomonas sp. TaxID=42353 RepID=UPI0025E13E72|nr:hypothetical protein [Nitrosomonas sp.]MBY0475403.1 hypothetical protein [Nitrosomonas sp.]
MVHFPILRTRRLTVQLKELSIGESIAIAAMPSQLEEAVTTAFLLKAVATVKGIENPSDWTVQERMMVVCHYLAAVSDDGPDFSVGDGRYSDYLEGSADIPIPEEKIEVGDVGGDVWFIQHMTGAMAESIERISGEVEGVTGRLHWLLGGMGAQLVRKDEEILSASDGEGAYDEFLTNRIRTISGYPESDFATLLNAYMAGRESLHHLFRIELSNDGFVALPKGGAASNLPPARFPVRSCVSRLAKDLGRESDEPGV